jgi:signal transduction histidine kinase
MLTHPIIGYRRDRERAAARCVPSRCLLDQMAESMEKQRDGVDWLAEEHAALARLTTLVARGTPPEELLAPVVEWARKLLPVESAHLGRYESNGTVAFVAATSGTGELITATDEMVLSGRHLARVVARTGRAARMDRNADDSVPIGVARSEEGSSLVAAPIVVEGVLWGVICGSIPGSPPTADIDARLASFTALMAGVIESAEGRTALARLAEEQAALRRVATLVARAAQPEELFAAVAEEVGQLLPVERTAMGHYEPDGETLTVLSIWSGASPPISTPNRWSLGGKNVPTLVAQTGRPARLDSYEDASGPIGLAARETGARASVGAPIIVDGRLWGVMIAQPSRGEALPADTEARLTEFTELVAMAIANAESRAELAASRARIVAAADETRRRIERDLHDGAQQRLVSLGLELRTAQAAVPPELSKLEGEMSHVADGLARLQEELREIARGIHPAILAEGGLERALKSLARRSSVPVELDVRARGRLPERVEVATYYIAAEALTNAAKHADASVVRVEVQASDGALRLSVSDDGGGGADPTRGTGLVGLKDRVQTLGGTIIVQSPPGAGTSIRVELPLAAQ